ncbi:sensor histidine kinase [Streptomyces sp. NPDC094447]|uniref:sensor histidine kinase n=1 Tax=Streptomyces sp. NPDC094447 TaxID=3366062 RepID=UPI00382EF5BA
MSQLRAPAPRSERREGGRHGRSGTRPAPGPGGGTSPRTPAPQPVETRIRPSLLRTSVLPAVAVALGWAAAVLFTLRSTGATPTPGLWAALTGAAAITVASVTAAALGADRVARTVLDRCHALRRAGARHQAELQTVVDQLRRGEEPAPRPAPTTAAASGDAFDLLSQELARSHEVAVAAVVQASRLSSSAGDEQKVEVFVNLARRLQSLVHREIQLLDELENEAEDPKLLKGLFHVDHLATRIRRHAENLAVLGGAVSRRQWSHPVTLSEVLRSSIAEVEQYPRVKLVPPVEGTLRGHAVADVIHLLAELVENATLFSAPHTTVLLRAQYVTAGLAVEVEDRGLGMPLTEQNRMNALLAAPDQVSVAHLLQDGRIGLFVVAALARRHGIAVRLQSNIYGGVQAVLVLPQGLLGPDPDGLPPHERQGAAHTGPAVVPPQGRPAESAPMAADPAPATTAPVRTPDPATTPDPTTASAPEAAPATAPAPDPHPAPAALDTTASTGAVPDPAPFPEWTAVHHDRSTAPAPLTHPRTDAPPRGPADPGPTPDDPAAAAHPPGPPADLLTPLPPFPPAPEAGGRPLLPKRRAQEHLVPQLRDEPADRGTEEHTLHDPGLMAAFQRGIGLAESRPAPHEPPRPGDAHKE